MTYEKYKTPIIKLAVANTANKEFIELPHQISRLVTGLEIFEALGKPCTFGQATLKFVEGSREPYPSGTKTELYNEKGFSFSNDSGMLSDLKFVGGGVGITDLLDVASDILDAGVDAALTALSPGKAFAPKEQYLEPDVPDPKPTGHVFTKGTLLRVTWGYVEDEGNQRSWVGSIKHLKTDYPESGHITTEIVAFEAELTLDQLVPKTGKVFVTNQGASGFKGKTIKEIVENVCEDAGFKRIISDNLGDVSIADDGRGFTWTSNMSINTFFKKLAQTADCVYRGFYDSETGIPTVYFVREEEHTQHIYLKANQFKYKAPGSILKSVALQAALEGTNTRASVQIGRDGKIISQEVDVVELVDLFENETPFDTNPLKNPGADTANNIRKAAPGQRMTGGTEYVPDTNNARGRGQAEARMSACGYPITIEFVSLGIPEITTTTIPITGLGTRFSGNYKIESLTHIIDNTGYTCRGIGKKGGEVTQNSSGGNTPNIKGNQGKGSEKVKLFLSSLGIKSDDTTSVSFTDVTNLLGN